MRNFFLIIVTLFISFGSKGQKKGDEIKHERELRDMIAFYQFMLNTLGDASTPNRDKDVLIMESYTKIFRDSKVQVEDDLDENRKVITNKDITAYLKDVDFFFKTVKFDFTIDAIKALGTSGDKLYYRVSLTRNLQGITSDGIKVNNTMPRFIEINFDNKTQDLKIASIYTHQFNEKQALIDWWNSLSFGWKAVFTSYFDVGDSVELEEIRDITSIDSLNISGNQFVQELDPLSQLHDLKFLDISSTAIENLRPLRNLTELEHINLAHTLVKDITPLKYAVNLNLLNLSATAVDSLQLLDRFINLETLNLTGVPFTDFSFIKNLSRLKTVDLSSTKFTDLTLIDSLFNIEFLSLTKTPATDFSPLRSLSTLVEVSLDSTAISDLSPFSQLQKLKTIHVNHTKVADLAPLGSIPSLERVYCDHTLITQQIANHFNQSRPNVLVIFDSDDLRGWWTDLPAVWRDVFNRLVKIGYKPTKEGLASLTTIDSLNIANYYNITSLSPLARLPKLQVLIANNTSISTIDNLVLNKNLRKVDITNTKVSDLTPLSLLGNLTTIIADRTEVREIKSLQKNTLLKNLFIDGNDIADSTVQTFLMERPNCLVVYKTQRLEEWWRGLPVAWQETFYKTLNIGIQPSKTNFHRLISSSTLTLDDYRINDLSPLNEFIRLKTLHVNSAGISDLRPLRKHKVLENLTINKAPLRDISIIGELISLKSLNISNTAVSDLKAVRNLKNLQELNCAGTQIRKLDGLEGLDDLQVLDCSNTRVKNLSPIMNLDLKELRIFNSKISSGAVKKYKDRHPETNVVFYR